MRARIELIYSAAVLSTSAVGSYLTLTTMLNANWTPDTPSEAEIKNNTQSLAALLVVISNIGLTLLLAATALFLVRFTHKWPCILIDYLVYYRSLDNDSKVQRCRRALNWCWNLIRSSGRRRSGKSSGENETFLLQQPRRRRVSNGAAPEEDV
jgi:hypothetical protein